MKYIKLFENTGLDIVSNKFWKMVDWVDWNSAIIGYGKSKTYHSDYQQWYEQAQYRLFSKYSFDEIQEFKNEYTEIYYNLYDHFEYIMNICQCSDDGFMDLISSIIGKGKECVKKCIKDPQLVIKMSKEDDYMENFGYLFNVDEEEYWEILAKKYNL
jgi:hypothetical protein